MVTLISEQLTAILQAYLVDQRGGSVDYRTDPVRVSGKSQLLERNLYQENLYSTSIQASTPFC